MNSYLNKIILSRLELDYHPYHRYALPVKLKNLIIYHTSDIYLKISIWIYNNINVYNNKINLRNNMLTIIRLMSAIVGLIYTIIR